MPMLKINRKNLVLYGPKSPQFDEEDTFDDRRLASGVPKLPIDIINAENSGDYNEED